MKPEQKELVRNTFAQILPIAEQAAALFYNRLFALAPEVKPLFKHNMEEQGRKLMQMIAIAVAHLDRLEELIPAVQALGKRHGAYGVNSAHYATVGAALLWTLEQRLGDAFTPEVKEAWTTVYTVLADTMQDAAAYAQPAAAD
ncbi:MAG TPA: globin family protein [Caldilineaceae bacterium]|nr:globin family protein [Caldilineaceae bacterium]